MFLTVFDGMICHSILVVLVSIVKLFALLQSYLSNRYLYAVANARESSQYPIQAGVPQGAV